MFSITRVVLFLALTAPNVSATDLEGNLPCGVIAGTCYDGPRNINGRSCHAHCSIDRPGGEYNKALVDSFDACTEACASDKYCMDAQFYADVGFCYFKNSLNESIVVRGVDTVECDGAVPYPWLIDATIESTTEAATTATSTTATSTGITLTTTSPILSAASSTSTTAKTKENPTIMTTIDFTGTTPGTKPTTTSTTTTMTTITPPLITPTTSTTITDLSTSTTTTTTTATTTTTTTITSTSTYATITTITMTTATITTTTTPATISMLCSDAQIAQCTNAGGSGYYCFIDQDDGSVMCGKPGFSSCSTNVDCQDANALQCVYYDNAVGSTFCVGTYDCSQLSGSTTTTMTTITTDPPASTTTTPATPMNPLVACNGGGVCSNCVCLPNMSGAAAYCAVGEGSRNGCDSDTVCPFGEFCNAGRCFNSFKKDGTQCVYVPPSITTTTTTTTISAAASPLNAPVRCDPSALGLRQGGCTECLCMGDVSGSLAYCTVGFGSSGSQCNSDTDCEADEFCPQDSTNRFCMNSLNNDRSTLCVSTYVPPKPVLVKCDPNLAGSPNGAGCQNAYCEIDISGSAAYCTCRNGNLNSCASDVDCLAGEFCDASNMMNSVCVNSLGDGGSPITYVPPKQKLIACDPTQVNTGFLGLGGCQDCYCLGDAPGTTAYCSTYYGSDSACKSDADCPVNEFCFLDNSEDGTCLNSNLNPDGALCTSTYGFPKYTLVACDPNASGGYEEGGCKNSYCALDSSGVTAYCTRWYGSGAECALDENCSPGEFCDEYDSVVPVCVNSLDDYGYPLASTYTSAKKRDLSGSLYGSEMRVGRIKPMYPRKPQKWTENGEH